MCYDDDESNCAKYGRLYFYSAAVDSAGIWSKDGEGCGWRYSETTCSLTYPVRGICPEGSHLPDTTEWKDLLGLSEFKDASYTPFTNFMAKNTSNDTWNKAAKDLYGFSMLPAGYGEKTSTGPSFSEIEKGANFACSDKNHLIRVSQNGGRGASDDWTYLASWNERLFSIRCVMDK